MNIDPMTMNNYGSSIIFGHPQGPTAGRLICEMIEELVLKGGGYECLLGVLPVIQGLLLLSRWVIFLLGIVQRPVLTDGNL